MIGRNGSRGPSASDDVRIDWLTGGDITEAHWDAFYQFYMQTGSRKWGRPYLNRTFFSLLGERTATLGARPQGFEYVSAQGNVLYVPMAGVLTVNNSDAYREACIAGLGIIQAPRVGRYLEDGTLVEILPKHRPPPLPIALLYANRRHLPVRVRVFIEWMREIVQTVR